MSLLVDHIGELVTNDPSVGEGALGVVRDAALVVEDGRVVWVGPSASVDRGTDEVLDAAGAAVVPGFVESHSHLVFAGDRAAEFAARMAGESYAAGGIRTTLAATRAASDGELGANLMRLAAEYRRQGTTTLEVKSGYGQTVTDESRSVQLAARLADEATLLAAHVVPPEYEGRADDYVRLVVEEMIPAGAPHARWIDVFCERGAFDVDQSRAVLTAGQAAGLGVRVHANQLTAGDGVRLGVELGAASVPLRAPDRRRRRVARRVDDRGHAAARGGLLDPRPLARRAEAARCRGDRGAGRRLQPRNLVHDVDAVHRGAGRA